MSVHVLVLEFFFFEAILVLELSVYVWHHVSRAIDLNNGRVTDYPP